MKRSVAVLGLGEYGKSLVQNLYRMGADVLAVDKNEELLHDFVDKCTSAICADLSNEEEVMALGLENMDIVVTAMGRNLAASIMSVAVAKEQGVPLVAAKSSSDRMSSILRKVGADRVINPEEESGGRSARVLLSSSFKDFYEIDDNMYMIEIAPKSDWIGRNLVELNLRKNHNLNVVAVRESGKSWHFVRPDEPFTADCTMLIVVEKKDVGKWK